MITKFPHANLSEEHDPFFFPFPPTYASLTYPHMYFLRSCLRTVQNLFSKICVTVLKCINTENRYPIGVDICDHRCVWPFVIRHIAPNEVCYIRGLVVHSSLIIVSVGMMTQSKTSPPKIFWKRKDFCPFIFFGDFSIQHSSSTHAQASCRTPIVLTDLRSFVRASSVSLPFENRGHSDWFWVCLDWRRSTRRRD